MFDALTLIAIRPLRTRSLQHPCQLLAGTATLLQWADVDARELRNATAHVTAHGGGYRLDDCVSRDAAIASRGKPIACRVQTHSCKAAFKIIKGAALAVIACLGDRNAFG